MITNRKVYKNGKVSYKYQKPQPNYCREMNIVKFIEADLNKQIAK